MGQSNGRRMGRTEISQRILGLLLFTPLQEQVEPKNGVPQPRRPDLILVVHSGPCFAVVARGDSFLSTCCRAACASLLKETNMGTMNVLGALLSYLASRACGMF